MEGQIVNSGIVHSGAEVGKMDDSHILRMLLAVRMQVRAQMPVISNSQFSIPVLHHDLRPSRHR